MKLRGKSFLTVGLVFITILLILYSTSSMIIGRAIIGTEKRV